MSYAHTRRTTLATPAQLKLITDLHVELDLTITNTELGLLNRGTAAALIARLLDMKAQQS